MQTKLGRNDRCSCGSGKKAKKCCGARRALSSYTTLDRVALFEELEDFVQSCFGGTLVEAHDDFWGPFVGREDELSEELFHLSNDAQSTWFACDFELEPGRTAIDFLLDHSSTLSPGARAFAHTMRASKMRVYEAMDLSPGVSITLRDVLDGRTVTVAERTASRSLNRFEWIAARVVDRGPSGKPEMERGVLAIPRLSQDWLLEQLTDLRAEALEDGDPEGFDASIPCVVHELWLSCLLEPAIPQLHNTDGDPLLVTRVHFDVRDEARLQAALDSCSELSHDQGHWSWSGRNPAGQVVSLGLITLTGRTLLLEANSKERGARGAELLTQLVGDAATYRATTHEDLEPQLREQLKGRARGDVAFGDAPQGGAAIPPAIAEAIVLDHYAKHYRAWVDESTPALDGKTPRAAAKRAASRPRVVALIQELESMYQQSLRDGAPAYDPSWMWAELGLQAEPDELPPPLPHERLDRFVEGANELLVGVAESIRARPGFDDAATVLERASTHRILDIQRFLKEHKTDSSVDAPAWQRRDLAPYMEVALNFLLHRRKAFWVEEALAYMLAQTDIEVPASDLRVPFASFALIFTDRHALSLGERLLSTRGAPLAGLILRVVTVFATERHDEAGRTLDLTFAFDALGDDLPELVQHSLPLSDGAQVQSLFPEEDELPLMDPPIKVSNPLRDLLQITVNAILYATSSGVEPEARAAGTPGRKRAKGSRPFTSESVFYLPGAIDITQVRRLKELARVGEGRDVLRRYLVRGHWRRAAKNWKDQRMRWIAPHWKGPEMAAAIERAYRLKA